MVAAAGLKRPKAEDAYSLELSLAGDKLVEAPPLGKR
jgi:hypothetical protein